LRKLINAKTSFFAIIIWMCSFSFVWASEPLLQSFPGKEYLKTKAFFDLTIMGAPIATKEQCVKYLFKRNPFPAIAITPKELVDYYYEEGMAEGIRPDVAFAQALHETGNFRYGGDVISFQNNYCGLGTTGNGVKGAWFPTPQIGVRAQIQHLLAYTTKRPPVQTIVDPRYELLKKTNKFGQSYTWTDLNGKWAVPGKTYGQMILKIHENIMLEKN